MDTSMTLVMGCKHGKTLSQVSLMLDSRIHRLRHYVEELTREPVSKHEIAAIAPHQYGYLVWTNKISCKFQRVLGQLGRHRLRILDMMLNFDLKVALKGHLLKLIYFYFFVPIAPNGWERWTLFGLEVLNLVIV